MVSPGSKPLTDVHRLDNEISGFPPGAELTWTTIETLLKGDFAYLVTYDLPALTNMLPFRELEAGPWIDVHRVVAGATTLTSGTIEGLLLERGHVTAAELLAAGRKPDIAWEAHGIAMLLNDLAAHNPMARLEYISRASVRPRRPAPAVCDARGWALVPDEDLGWWADYRDHCRVAGIQPQATPTAATCARAAAERAARRHASPLWTPPQRSVRD